MSLQRVRTFHNFCDSEKSKNHVFGRQYGLPNGQSSFLEVPNFLIPLYLYMMWFFVRTRRGGNRKRRGGIGRTLSKSPFSNNEIVVFEIDIYCQENFKIISRSNNIKLSMTSLMDDPVDMINSQISNRCKN